MYKNNFVVCLKTKDGKILRDDNGVVRLPFGSEYSIYLKNLNSRKAKIEITIDGEDVLDGNSIIVDEDKTSEIKGFLKGDKVKNSFKFIEKIKEISEYRGDKIDDGLVRVKITYEKEKVEYPIYYPQEKWFHEPVEPLRITYDTHTNPYEVYYSNNTESFDNGGYININDDKLNLLHEPETILNNNQVQNFINRSEGITVKGSEINQSIKNGSMGILEENATIIVLRLTGYKQNSKKVDKPITVKTKNQCPTCGKMCKSNNRYCDQCGTCLV